METFMKCLSKYSLFTRNDDSSFYKRKYTQFIRFDETETGFSEQIL